MPRHASSLIHRIEIPTLFAVAFVLGATWLFAGLVDELDEGGHAIDEWLLLALREPGEPDRPVGPWWLQIALRDLTSLGSIAVLAWITIGAFGYLLLRGLVGRALFVLASTSLGMILSSLLKQGVDRPRPDLVAALVEVHTLSFPSGHAMLSAVAYLTLGILVASGLTSRAGRIYVLSIAVLTTMVVGFSRVYLGVHWPTDVIAGWAAGAAWALACWLVLRLMEGRLIKRQPG